MAPPTGPAPPPTLPPSVEEAYSRKCALLKQRLNEVEEANDAARVRLVRLQRAINKLRLERGILVEALTKRTSTNVEDSEGSPSPPPTPKEKPLRTKRGHRKIPYLNNNDGLTSGTFIQQGPVTLSPSGSDAFSHTHPEPHTLATSQVPSTKRLLQSSNGISANYSATPPPSKPKSAFELFGNELRESAYRDGNLEPDRALAQKWQAMDDSQKAEYQHKFDDLKNAEKEGAGNGVAAGRDDDVEMGDGEEERDEGGDGGGFTAVNKE